MAGHAGVLGAMGGAHGSGAVGCVRRGCVGGGACISSWVSSNCRMSLLTWVASWLQGPDVVVPVAPVRAAGTGVVDGSGAGFTARVAAATESTGRATSRTGRVEVPWRKLCPLNR